jgi:hypothetical protein
MYMTKGFLMYEEMRKYEEAVSHPLPSEFRDIRGKFSFLFYQCSIFVHMQVMTTASAPPSFVPGFMSKAGKHG